MILNSQVEIGTWFVGDWRSNDNSTFFPKLPLFLDHQEYKIVYILSFFSKYQVFFFTTESEKRNKRTGEIVHSISYIRGPRTYKLSLLVLKDYKLRVSL